MKKIIGANFHPVLTWHPSWPRKKDGKEEKFREILKKHQVEFVEPGK